MRVGRKFQFYALVLAMVSPTTPYESAFARLFVAAGSLWYLPRGAGRVSIYDEPNEDVGEARDEAIEQDGDDAENDADGDADFEAAAVSGVEGDEEAASGTDRQARGTGRRPKPVSCTVLLRDFEGIVPLLHPGQYVSVTLVRAGMYERAANGRVRERPAPATLDFHQHIYDVVRCSMTTTRRQMELRTLRSALGQADSLILVEQSRQRRDSRREKAASGAPEEAVRRRGAYVARGNLYKEITAAFHSHRSSMSWLGGLIAALPASVRTAALLAFTPFYQAHSAAYGPRENIGALLSHVRAPGREVCLWSVIELQCISHYERIDHRRRLTISERLFFGALVGRMPLCEYEHAVGRWHGAYYKEPAPDARDVPARVFAHWTRAVCDVVGLPKRPLSAVARNIGYVAWALYDASAKLLSERAGAPDASTVLSGCDVLAYVAARRRHDRRFADQACLDSAIKVLTEIDVWRAAPDNTVVRLAVAHQRAGRASDYFSEAPSDRSLHAAVLLTRTYDVSERLAQSVFDAQLRFCDTATFYADLLPLGRRTTFLYYSVRPNVPDRGVKFVALPRLLEQERENPTARSNFRLTALTSDAIVLLDAHMFTEVQLLRTLLLVANLGNDEHRAVPRQLFAVGDTHICSPFASLALAAAQHPRAARYARVRPRADAHPLQCAIYDAMDMPLVSSLALQLRSAAVSPPWKLEPGEANVQRRWILVAHTHAAASSALGWLARSIAEDVDRDDDDDADVDDKVDFSVLDHRTNCMHEALLELAQRPRLLESTLLLAAPWVGYHGRCVRVLRVLAEVRPRTRLDETILESACLSIDAGSLTQAVSLDSDALLLELAPDTHTADYEDHRLCCDTWAANVLSVAVHRAHLCSQSLPLARDALPCDGRLTSGTALLLTSDYTLDTLYAAAVRATYHARTIVTLAAPDAQPREIALARRLPLSLTCIGDLYRILLDSLA